MDKYEKYDTDTSQFSMAYFSRTILFHWFGLLFLNVFHLPSSYLKINGSGVFCFVLVISIQNKKFK